MAYEQPIFEVVGETDNYEIRRYEPYIVAEVDVDGGFRDAGNSAFGVLAGYIFGENYDDRKMAMTVPVESRDADEGERMSMAIPVTSTEDAAGDRYTYAFVMERKYTMETLPKPKDPRIRLKQQDERVMAVLRYSGRWTENRYRTHEMKLLDALRADGVEIVGEPVFARYNGPLTPWFMRRNEVMVEVRIDD